MILIIDNYDSFTHNLVQCIGKLGYNVNVVRNDDVDINSIETLKPTHIILSPGPGNPNHTGISLKLIRHYADSIPILGICLGHQSIAYVYGGHIKQLDQPMHGKLSKIWHNSADLFNELPNPFVATRYHSLVIDQEHIPKDLEVTAQTEDGVIMACRHKKYTLLRGIQFHPESLWTENGEQIIKNFLVN